MAASAKQITGSAWQIAGVIRQTARTRGRWLDRVPNGWSARQMPDARAEMLASPRQGAAAGRQGIDLRRDIAQMRARMTASGFQRHASNGQMAVVVQQVADAGCKIPDRIGRSVCGRGRGPHRRDEERHPAGERRQRVGERRCRRGGQ
jgi:hypothetical protein